MMVYLIIGLSYGFAAAVQPGPFQAYLISQTLNIGWRRTVPATFAPLISDIPIAILMLVLLSAVPQGFVKMLHYLGGVFVLYLALGAFKSWWNFNMNTPDTQNVIRQSMGKAVLVNLLNPAPYLGWSLVMGPLLLKGWRETPTYGVSLVIAFYAAMIVTTTGILIVFSAARNFGPKVTRSLLAFSVLALIGFGLYQLWLGYSAY
jgi:threonine/homoserine/homoserine lactone efflux protein